MSTFVMCTSAYRPTYIHQISYFYSFILASDDDQVKHSDTFTEVKARRPRLVLEWVIGDHQERLGAVNLGPFIGVDLNL